MWATRSQGEKSEIIPWKVIYTTFLKVMTVFSLKADSNKFWLKLSVRHSKIFC